MKKVFQEIVYNTILSIYPFEYDFSDSKLAIWWKKFKMKQDIVPDIIQTLDNLKTNKNYPFYWYNANCSIEDSYFYAKNMKIYNFKICSWCQLPFAIKDGHKSCCSLDHWNLQLQRRNMRLSKSKQNYNSRDPIQYSLRHNITVSEAEAHINTMVREGSHRCVEFWLKRGYTEEEAKSEISKKQSEVSPRTVSYWMTKGYTETEAIEKVSKRQSELSAIGLAKYTTEDIRARSAFTINFWMHKGKTKDEAIQIVKSISEKGRKTSALKYTQEERKQHNVQCKEFWIKRYPDNWREKYEMYLTRKQYINIRSKISDEFVTKMSLKFPDDILYYKNNEFCLATSDKGYIRLDFTNISKMFCIEFYGDYWHANPNTYQSQDLIIFPNKILKRAQDIWDKDATRLDEIRIRGYKTYIVWEMDYRQDADQCVEKLYEEIMNENS